MRIQELFENKHELYFHATGEKFDTFDHRQGGFIGFYFTKNYDEVLHFLKNRSHSKDARIIAAHLVIKNPAPPEAIKYAQGQASGGNPRKIIREILIRQGYDSIVRPNETIVFEPEQIHIVDHDYKSIN